MFDNRRPGRVRVILLALLTCACAAGAAFWFAYVRSTAYRWKQANNAIHNEAWPVAEIHLKNLIAANPQDADARLALANVYRAVSINAARERGEKSRRAASIDPPLATEQLLEVSKLRPDDTEVRTRLLAAYRQAGRGDAAAQVARELAELGHTNTETLLIAASAALDAKEFDRAEGLIERAKTATTRLSPIPWWLHVRLLSGRNENRDINNYLEPLLLDLSRKTSLDLSGFSETEMTILGEVMLAGVQKAISGDHATQRFALCVAIMERLALTPRGQTLRAILVESLVRLLPHAQPTTAAGKSRLKSASEQLMRFAQPVLDADQVSPLAYEQLARAAAEAKDHSRALSLLRRGLELHRQLPAERQRELLSLHRSCALQLLSLGRFAEANEQIQPLLAITETARLGHVLAAVLAFDERRLDDAARHIEQARASERDALLDAIEARVMLARNDWRPASELLARLEAEWADLPAGDVRWMTATLGGRDALRFQRARCLMQLGEVEAADTMLRTLESGPLKAAVRPLRIVNLLQQSQRSDAWDLLRQARRDAPDDANLVLLEFGLLLEEKAIDGAARLLAGHIQRVPSDLRMRLLMAQWLHARGELDQSLAQLADIKKSFADQPIGWLLTADVLMQANRDVELDKLVQAMRVRPVLAAWIPLVQAHRRLRQAGLAEASDALRQATPEIQRSAAYHVTSALVALRRGDASRAFDLFADSLQFSNVRAPARNGFWQAFQQVLESPNAATLGPRIDELVKQYPQEPSVLLASAELAMRRRDFATVAARIDELQECDTVAWRPAFLRARLSSAEGQVDRALTQLQPLLDQPSPPPAVHLLAAQALHARNDHAAALEQLDWLPASAKDDPTATLLRASVLSKLDQRPVAMDLLTQLTQRQPKFAPAWLALAVLQNANEQRESAIQTIEQALRHLPDQPELQIGLVELLLRSNRSDQAQLMALRFAQSKTDAATMLRFAQMFLDSGQNSAADTWLQRARRQSPQPTDELLFLEALASYQQGVSEKRDVLFAQARVKYDAALKLNPRHISALNNLAWLLLQQFSQPAEALAVVEQLRLAVAVEQLPPAILDTLAEVYRRSGHSADALKIVVDAVERFPNAGLLRLQYGALLADGAGNDSDKRAQSRQQLELAQKNGVPADRLPELNALLTQVSEP